MVTDRPGTEADAIDGVVPGRVVEPVDAESVSHILREAAMAHRATVVRGGGTKLGWGRPPARVDQVLSLARVQGPLVHRDGDLTVTVGASTRLSDLNGRLREKGQWLPVESAHAETTIGGLVATNDAGPRRHRYGTSRDLLIGVTLALADGRMVKAGGTVVKNVAGYDLGRFVSGSLGALAVVLDATFKLAPVPTTSATIRLGCASARDVAAACAEVMASQLEPVAVDVAVRTSGGRVERRDVLVRFATSPRATDSQAHSCRQLLRGGAVLEPDEEVALWRGQVVDPWRAGTTMRFSWAPADMEAALAAVEACGVDSDVTFAGRGGVGVGLLQSTGDVSSVVRIVERLRATPALQHVSVLQAPVDVKRRVDVWGGALPWAAPLLALKRTLDPAGVLGADRGPL